jgi:DNA-binding NarL/FixJ family response regulator
MNSNAVTVGLIDDDELYTCILTTLLEREGMEVLFQAFNGKTGIAELAPLVFKPKVLIVDIQMPVMGGYEVIDFVKKTWPDMMIIAHSSLTDIKAQQKAIDCGADAFILKCGDMTDLIGTILELTKGIEQ